MNKIGFKIKRVSGGASDGITVNDGDWTRRVVDLRDVIKLCDVNGGGRFIMFMSFGVDGTYLTVMRPISGRDGDNVAAWMYIPNEIDIDGATVVDIVAKVKAELSQPMLNAAFIERLFDRAYPTDEAVQNVASAKGLAFAVRRTGVYPLDTILGMSRYQSYYTKYSAIIIEDVDSMRVVDASVADLTGAEIKTSMVFCPPMKSDLPLGVTVSYVDNKKRVPFTSPIRVLKDEIIRIVFSKAGFDDIKLEETIYENQQICSLPRGFDWQMTITTDRFKIMAKSPNGTRALPNAIIKINGIRLRFDDPVKLSESAARNAKVEISCSGFETAEKEVDFVKERTVSVVLARKTETVEANIDLANGSAGKITLEGKGLRSVKDAPIKGYRMNGGWLEYNSFEKWKNICIGFFTALALIVIIWGGIQLYDAIFGKEPTDNPKTSISGGGGTDDPNPTPPVGDDDPIHNKYKPAVEYLDTTQQWNRTDMENILGLGGLYDALNSCQFQQVLNTINELGNEDIIKEDGYINYLKAEIQRHANSEKLFEKYSKDGTITLTGFFKDLVDRNKAVSGASSGNGVSKIDESAKRIKEEREKEKEKEKEKKRGGI